MFGWWLFCVWVLDGVPVGFFDDSSRRLRGMDNPSVIIWVCCVLYIYIGGELFTSSRRLQGMDNPRAVHSCDDCCIGINCY